MKFSPERMALMRAYSQGTNSPAFRNWIKRAISGDHPPTDDLDEQFPGFEGKNHSVDISRQQAAPPDESPTSAPGQSLVPGWIKLMREHSPDLAHWHDTVQVKALHDYLMDWTKPQQNVGSLQRLRQSSNNSPTHGPRSVRRGDPDLEYLDGQQGAAAWNQQRKL